MNSAQIPPTVFKPRQPAQALLVLLALQSFDARPAAAQARPPAALPATPPSSVTPTAAIPTIAMMPFDGKESATPPRRPMTPMNTSAAVGDMLSARPQAKAYKVLTPDLWAGMARLKYRGKSTDLKPIARLVKATVVVGGYLEATPGNDAPKPYRLTLSVYDDQGLLLGQLGYDLDKPVVTPQALVGQANAFFQMVDQGLKLPPPISNPPTYFSQSPVRSPSPYQAGPSSAPTPHASGYPTSPAQSGTYDPIAVGGVYQHDDKEDAPLSTATRPLVPQTADAHELYDRRAPWQQALDLSLSYLFNTRAVDNVGSELRFPRAGASGLMLSAALHPLSLLPKAPAALVGLGFRLTALLPFWDDIAQVSKPGGGSSGRYSAEERRVEVALRWHYNPWNDVLRPDFEVEGLFGDHIFSTAPKENIDYLRLPPADYRYLGGSFGSRLFFSRRVSAHLGFTFAKLMSMGLVTAPGVDLEGASLRDQNGFQSYGPGSGWLWRTNASVTLDVYHGITLGTGLYFEQNMLSFEGKGNIVQSDGKTPVTSAKDEYLGFMLTLGYAYRPYTK